MGKAAENERIKLRATFWNNVGVGMAIAGAITPAFAFYQNQIPMFLAPGAKALVPTATLIIITVVALALATGCRFYSDSLLKRISD